MQYFLPNWMICKWFLPCVCSSRRSKQHALGGWGGWAPLSEGPDAIPLTRCLQRICSLEITAFLRRSPALPGLQGGSEDFSTSYSAA